MLQGQKGSSPPKEGAKAGGGGWNLLKMLNKPKFKAAHMGEENNMYFHTEMNRWVERGKEAEAAKEAAEGMAPPPMLANFNVAAPGPRKDLGARYAMQSGLAIKDPGPEANGPPLLEPPSAFRAAGGVHLGRPGAPSQTNGPPKFFVPGGVAQSVPTGNPFSQWQTNKNAAATALSGLAEECAPHSESGSTGQPEADDSAENASSAGSTEEPAVRMQPDTAEPASVEPVTQVEPLMAVVALAGQDTSNGAAAYSHAAVQGQPFMAMMAPSVVQNGPTSNGPEAYQPVTLNNPPSLGAWAAGQNHATGNGTAAYSMATAAPLPGRHSASSDGGPASSNGRPASEFDEFDRGMHPGVAHKLDGPLPWELPDPLKMSDQFISICANWQQNNPGKVYSPSLLLESIKPPVSVGASSNAAAMQTPPASGAWPPIQVAAEPQAAAAQYPYAATAQNPYAATAQNPYTATQHHAANGGQYASYGPPAGRGLQVVAEPDGTVLSPPGSLSLWATGVQQPTSQLLLHEETLPALARGTTGASHSVDQPHHQPAVSAQEPQEGLEVVSDVVLLPSPRLSHEAAAAESLATQALHSEQQSTTPHAEQQAVPLYPEQHALSLAPEQHAAQLYTEQQDGHAYPQQHAGYVDPEQHAAQLYTEQQDGHAYPQQYAGYVDPEQHAGHAYSEQQAGYVDPEQHAGHAYSEQQAGYVDPEQHATQLYTEQQDGHAYPQQYAGYVDPEQHAGHAYSEQQAGYADPEQHAGHAYSEQHAGYADPEQHAGHAYSEQQAGYVDQEQHAAAYAHPAQYAGHAYSEQQAGYAYPEQYTMQPYTEQQDPSLYAEQHAAHAYSHQQDVQRDPEQHAVVFQPEEPPAPHHTEQEDQLAAAADTTSAALPGAEELAQAAGVVGQLVAALHQGQVVPAATLQSALALMQLLQDPVLIAACSQVAGGPGTPAQAQAFHRSLQSNQDDAAAADGSSGSVGTAAFGMDAAALPNGDAVHTPTRHALLKVPSPTSDLSPTASGAAEAAEAVVAQRVRDVEAEFEGRMAQTAAAYEQRLVEAEAAHAEARKELQLKAEEVESYQVQAAELQQRLGAAEAAEADVKQQLEALTAQAEQQRTDLEHRLVMAGEAESEARQQLEVVMAQVEEHKALCQKTEKKLELCQMCLGNEEEKVGALFDVLEANGLDPQAIIQPIMDEFEPIYDEFLEEVEQ